MDIANVLPNRESHGKAIFFPETVHCVGIFSFHHVSRVDCRGRQSLPNDLLIPASVEDINFLRSRFDSIFRFIEKEIAPGRNLFRIKVDYHIQLIVATSIT